MLELRRFEQKDCAALVQWIPDPQFLLQWAGPRYSFPLTASQVEEAFRQTQKTDPDHLMFKAVNRASQVTVGHIELMRIDRIRKAAHMCRVLICRPEDRGRGYGSRMITMLVDFAFNAMGIRDLTLTVLDTNRQAIACYTKIGFRLSYYHENIRFRDRSCTLIAMKLTRDYWLTQMDTS